MRHAGLRLSSVATRTLSTLPGRGVVGVGSAPADWPRRRRQTMSSQKPLRWQSTAAVEGTAESATSSNKMKESEAPPKAFVPTPERKYEFFQNVEINPQGVAIVRFDNLSKPVNTISFKLAAEAEKLWGNEIESNDAVKAVVFSSGKPGMFIAGADIFDIQQMEDKSDLVPFIADGLAFFQKMRQKGVPLVAAIDGPALGGGLEWALWCDYRICTDNSKTKVRKTQRRHSTSLSTRQFVILTDGMI